MTPPPIYHHLRSNETHKVFSKIRIWLYLRSAMVAFLETREYIDKNRKSQASKKLLHKFREETSYPHAQINSANIPHGEACTTKRSNIYCTWVQLTNKAIFMKAIYSTRKESRFFGPSFHHSTNQPSADHTNYWSRTNQQTWQYISKDKQSIKRSTSTVPPQGAKFEFVNKRKRVDKDQNGSANLERSQIVATDTDNRPICWIVSRIKGKRCLSWVNIYLMLKWLKLPSHGWWNISVELYSNQPILHFFHIRYPLEIFRNLDLLFDIQ